MENVTLKEANQLFLNGKIAECIRKLGEVLPQNEEIKAIASRYSENEKDFIDGYKERSAYDVTKAQIRKKIQEFLKSFNNSIYKILFIASNPDQLNPLNYGKEFDEITSILQRKNNRDLFDIKPKFAAEKLNLIDLVNEYKPQLIYFSMHGTNNNELEFTNAIGQPDSLSLDDLIGSIKHLSNYNNITCSIFNTCKSDDQARAASQFIPYAIGMKESIDDMASIIFARGFFEQFFNNSENIPQAFDNGVIYLQLHDNSGIRACANIPILFKR